MSVTSFNLRRRKLKEAIQHGKQELQQKEEEKEMTEDEMRDLAKELKIKSYHNMKLDTLKERLSEHGY